MAARQVVTHTPSERFSKDWNGYRLDLLGVGRHIDIGGAYTTGHDGNGGPSFRLHDEAGILQLDLELWRQRARQKDGPLVAEIYWWPGAPRGDVQDVFRVRVPAETEIGQQDLRAAQRARRLLHQLTATASSGGQPGQYDEANEPQFFQELSDTVHRVVRAGERVGYSSIARHGASDRRTIKKYVEMFDYDLGSLEVEAIRCTQNRGLCTVHVRRKGNFKKKRQ